MMGTKEGAMARQPKYRVVIRSETTVEAFDDDGLRELMALGAEIDPDQVRIEAGPAPALPKPERVRRWPKASAFYFAVLALVVILGLMVS
jgi:hypothetical protein